LAKTKTEGKGKTKSKTESQDHTKTKEIKFRNREPPTGTPTGVAFLFYGGVMRKRDEIVAEIKRVAEKLGRAPSKAELCKSGRISWHQVYKHFRGMRAAVRAAGLEPGPRGCPADENVMVLDWGRVVRELGRLPSRAEYDERGKHHSVTLHARLGWSQMAHRFVLLVREFHVEAEWKDVVEVVWRKFPLLARVATGRWQLANSNPGFTAEVAKDAKGEELAAGLRRWPQIGQGQVSRELTRTNANQINVSQINVSQINVKPGMRLGKVVAAALAVELLMSWAVRSQQMSESEAGNRASVVATEPEHVRREIYGAPLGIAAMAHAPTNEAGVLFLFGAVAAGLGFRVERLQAAFPDGEAKREIRPGKWERVRIEFEFESRNFREHRHDPEGCDVIVCWRHNWADAPEGLEIVELSRLVE
jgi:hypothetical protein